MKNFTLKNTISNLLTRINQHRDGEHFYNLPIVQICTRSISRLSVHPRIHDIFKNTSMTPLNRGLIEIITAFYRGSGGSTQSFMGKSVISNASFALSNNVAWEIYSKTADSLIHAEIGIEWLIPLLKFRSVQTRGSALSILLSLSHSEKGAKGFGLAVTAQCD